MASVFLATTTDGLGFSRVVAVKRLHPHVAHDPRFVEMFLDEARLAMRVRHANVVSTLEAVASGGEVFLVMDYVPGESLGVLLATLRESARTLPPPIASSLMAGALSGMHAAHEAADEAGRPLHIVHRDVSPQNILVGADGVARVLDFGVAKAAGQLHSTEDGQIKGKLRYMAPEQLTGGELDRRVDICAAGIVLWEALAGKHLFDAGNPGQVVNALLTATVPPPSQHASGIPPELDRVVLRALARNREERFATAREMAMALEEAMPPASARQVGDFVLETLGPRLRARDVAAAAAMQATAHGTQGDLARITLAPAAVGTSEVPSEEVGAAVRGALAKDADTALTPATTTVALAAPRRLRRRARASAVAALVLVSLGATFWFARWSLHADNASPRQPAPSPSYAAASGLPSNATPEAASLPLANAPTPVDSSPSSQPPDTPQSVSAAAPSRAAAAPARTAPPRRIDCRNPFSVDARGYRVPRPECFP
jgi:serine/threonine-protein kinase